MTTSFISKLDNTYLFRFDTMTQNFYILSIDGDEVSAYDEQGKNYTFKATELETLAEQGRLSYFQLVEIQLAGYPSAKQPNVAKMLTQKVDKKIKLFVDSALA